MPTTTVPTAGGKPTLVASQPVDGPKHSCAGDEIRWRPLESVRIEEAQRRKRDVRVIKKDVWKWRFFRCVPCAPPTTQANAMHVNRFIASPSDRSWRYRRSDADTDIESPVVLAVVQGQRTGVGAKGVGLIFDNGVRDEVRCRVSLGFEVREIAIQFF